MGQGEPESPFPMRNRDVSGGINNKLFATDIAENQSQQLKNIRTDVLGIRQTRPGSSLAATGITYGPVLALREFNTQAGSSKLLAVAPGGSAGDHARLYEWDGTGSAFSFVGAMTGYTGGVARDYSIVNGIEFDNAPAGGAYVAVISDDLFYDGNQRYYYDGSALGQTDWPVDGSQRPVFAMSSFAGRMLARGQGSNSSFLFYSDTAACVTAGFASPATRWFKFGGDASQAIVAVSVIRNNIVVFMKDRFDVLDTSYKGYQYNIGNGNQADLTPGSNWSVVGGHETLGCGSRKSIANAGEDLFFADQYGNIRSLARTIADTGQGVSTLPVSDPIQGWIDRINPAAISKIRCHVYDRWLVAGLPIDSATDADHVFVMDTIRSRGPGGPVWDGPWQGSTRAWRPESMTVASLSGATSDADKSPTLYVGGTVTANYTDPGLVYRTFSGTDDSGSDLEYQEITKRRSGGTFEVEKTWERLLPQLVGSGAATMQVEASLDAKGWEHVGYVSLLGAAPVLPVDLPFTLGGTGIVAKTLSLEDLSSQSSRDISFRYTVTSSTVTKFLGDTVFGYMENWDRTPDDG